jgi:hypothetical protein
MQGPDFVACLVCKKGNRKDSQREGPPTKWLANHCSSGCFTEENWELYKQYYKVELAPEVEAPTLPIDTVVLLNDKNAAEKHAQQLQADLNKALGANTRLNNELLEVKEALAQSRKAPPPPTTLLHLQTEWENEQKHKYMKGYKDRDDTIAALKAEVAALKANGTQQVLKQEPKDNTTIKLQNHKDVVEKVIQDLRKICQDPVLTNMTVLERECIKDKAQDSINLLVNIDDGIPPPEKPYEDDEEENDEDEHKEPEPKPPPTKPKRKATKADPSQYPPILKTTM